MHIDVSKVLALYYHELPLAYLTETALRPLKYVLRSYKHGPLLRYIPEQRDRYNRRDPEYPSDTVFGTNF